MRHVVAALLLIAAVIHLMPLLGLPGGEGLSKLYGIEVSEPNLSILMRHRAVLFGLLGSFMVLAIFKPALRTLAIVAGLVSLVSFLWLAWSVGGYNANIARVFNVDVIAVVALVIAALLHWRLSKQASNG